MISTGDKHILRELAKQQMELAADDKNRERESRIRQMHSLKAVRPPVWIDEIPWHEMDINDELALRCESERAREMERDFRRVLFRWKYFQADMVVEDAFYILKSYTSTDTGAQIVEDTLATDDANHIVSHRYEDRLDTPDKVHALCPPILTARTEMDAKNVELAESLFHGIMPVRLRGHGIYYAPWDQISMLRGMENCLLGMLEEPELMHATIEKFTEIGLAHYEQMEALGLLGVDIPSLHCTPPYTDALPAADFDGGRVRLKDVWFRGMGQLFASASPQMQDEFDLQYMRRLMDRCGLSYYGCCEPLDRVIPYLKRIPNLRKIGVSPWADLRSCAEQIGADYVLARKPNPALVAGVFDAEVVRREIRETITLCMENGCPYEFVLKDISTVGRRPESLISWTQTVMETINEYYD